MPKQKNLCSTKAWNAFCGFKMNRGARLEPGAHPHTFASVWAPWEYPGLLEGWPPGPDWQQLTLKAPD